MGTVSRPSRPRLPVNKRMADYSRLWTAVRGVRHRNWSRCALRWQAHIPWPLIVEYQLTRHPYGTSSILSTFRGRHSRRNRMSMMDYYLPPHDRSHPRSRSRSRSRSPALYGPGYSSRDMQARLRVAALEVLARNQHLPRKD